MEERIVELEIKAAYQEKTLNDLNEVVLRQQEQIERVEKQLAALKQQVADQNEQAAPVDDPPPHY